MRVFLALALALLPGWASAHEFWIDAPQWQVAPGSTLNASLRNGEAFKGIELAYFESRIARFELVQEGRRVPVTGRMGDRPALSVPVSGPGLIVAAYESVPQTLTYSEWPKFARFAAHKDFSDIAARHDARGLPRAGFTERYTRHAKALFAAGDGAGADSALGLETEFVALSNPYTDDGPVRVQLLYQGAPRADAQVEVFTRAPDGNVAITTTRTDAQGRADIPVTPGHAYLLDAVVLRPGRGDIAWETLWAAMTFAIPD
ncbi:MAG: DUF4198 domain-containing protein [Pseudomonadota bacterium]